MTNLNNPKMCSAYGTEKQRRAQEATRQNERGEQQFAAGHLAEAVDAFTKAIALDPEKGVYYNNLATALFALGNTDHAWRTIVRAMHVDPFLACTRANLADMAAALGNETDANRMLLLFGNEVKREELS